MVEQFIYDTQAQELFYEKLDDFHDKYVYHLLFNGLAKKGEGLESIKMTKNPDASIAYCRRVIGGLVNVKPEVIVRLTEDRQTKLECIFTHINNGENINHLYMIQNVIDWPQRNKYSCQIWYLGLTTMTQVKGHWSE